MTLTPTKKATTFMMTYEQIQQMFNEDSDDDEPIQDCDLYTSIYAYCCNRAFKESAICHRLVQNASFVSGGLLSGQALVLLVLDPELSCYTCIVSTTCTEHVVDSEPLTSVGSQAPEFPYRSKYYFTDSGLRAASAVEPAKYSPRLVLHGRNEKALSDVKQKCLDHGLRADDVRL
ncbi:hypothetical protein LSH36_193g09017 [Paralvinella palmiformis]|uniref:Uncharacterized protein n=1 Tax=Paralvinella palmiformis TaxID=53620 RepID=A0AAD9JQ62_9ANNE|nr:hypothetical protein LSH36_193g09017 [Paralvinella palmiformis]